MDTVIDRCFGAEHTLVDVFAKQAVDNLEVVNVCKFGLWTVPSFMSEEECASVLQRTENLGYEDAPVTTGSGPMMMKDYRNNLRVMVQDQASADLLFLRIKPYIPLVLSGMVAVGLNERFRYYKYDPGMFFQQHYDGSFYRSRVEWSLLTVLVNLNEGYEGGETAFYDRRLPNGKYLNQAQTGKVVLFQHRGWLHEGTLLMQGRKYLMRSDVMYRRYPQEQLEQFVGQRCGYCQQSVTLTSKSCGHHQLACECEATGSKCLYC